ncbi:MAG: Unknown protein [uncultured Sulfurovum sp.]|uniref:Tandem-95 repeat protein n=1 Tax=uncultured Sulfurovum sp. TaxID=269237 RepID=A0A6S6SFK1_9BACT|nr:MAG: Unknown protein [uncultured Sulfurovum sp.]
MQNKYLFVFSIFLMYFILGCDSKTSNSDTESSVYSSEEKILSFLKKSSNIPPTKKDYTNVDIDIKTNDVMIVNQYILENSDDINVTKDISILLYSDLDNDGVNTIDELAQGTNPDNKIPQVQNDTFLIQDDNVLTMDILINDKDETQLTLDNLIIVNKPLYGVLKRVGNVLEYISNNGYEGEDSFQYKLLDNKNEFSKIATVNITVKLKEQNNVNVIAVNDAPLGVEDNVSTQEDTAITIDVLKNDTDTEGDSLSIATVSTASHGSTSIVENKVRYTPEANFHGEDTFTYRAYDGTAESAVVTVTVNVIAVNDAPLGVDDEKIGLENEILSIGILDNDIRKDANIDKDSITFIQTPIKGSLSKDTLGQVSYVPNANTYGEDSFTYTIKDVDGLVSNEVNVTIYIAASDGSTDVDEDNLSDILELRFGSDPLVSGSDIGITDEDKNLLHKLNRLTWGASAEVFEDVESKGGFELWLSNQLITELMPEIGNFESSDYPAQYKLDNYYMYYYRSTEVPASIRPLHSKRYLQTVMGNFWDNHFNTNLNLNDRDTKELYESDVFYENAFGSFENLLTLSAESYTMSYYLNGFQNTKGGPNENYAREVMELHTLGLDNYTDTDISELARVFTGRGFYNNGKTSRYKKYHPTSGRLLYYERIYEFKFDASNHDVGAAKNFLGHTIPTRTGELGVEEGKEAIHILATHPKTAEYICKKLANKFVSDTPTNSTLTACENTFLNPSNMQEQIKEVLETLFTSDEFNDINTHNTKAKDDQEYFIGFARGLGADATRYDGNSSSNGRLKNIGWALKSDRLKQPFFQKPEPTGYYETSEHWIKSDHLFNRIVESNKLIDKLETNHLVNYFKSKNMTEGTDIIRYVISIYMNGYYKDSELKVLYDTLYVNHADFDINSANAENELRALFHTVGLMPKTHLQ